MEQPTDSDDEREYEAMFRRRYAAVSRYALRRAPADVAGDAVAEMFLLAWRTFDRRPANELAWLLAVARRAPRTSRNDDLDAMAGYRERRRRQSARDRAARASGA